VRQLVEVRTEVPDHLLVPTPKPSLDGIETGLQLAEYQIALEEAFDANVCKLLTVAAILAEKQGGTTC
jgi:hypothetical protein